MIIKRITSISFLLLFWGVAFFIVIINSKDNPVYDNVMNNELWEREQEYINFANRERIGNDPFSLRQAPIADHPNSDAVRVLTIGDSATWGYGLRDLSIRWWELLELELDQRTANGSFDVSTIAQPGASLYSFYDWINPEMIERVDPDVIVVLVNLNDAVPLGDESLICKRKECTLYPTLERSKEYITCMSESNTILELDRPALSNWCAKSARDFLNEELLSEYDISGFKIDRFNTLFEKAISGLFDVAGDRPVIVIPAITTQTDSDSFSVLLRKFEEAGAIIASNKITSSRMAIEPTHKGWWAHPLDRHPGYYATSAYSTDAANAILENLPTTRISDAVRHALPRSARLIDSFLPSSAQINTTNNNSTFLLNPWPNEILPADLQMMPCADIGRPHIRLMFDRRLPDSTNALIKLENAASSLTIFSTGYKNGLPFYREIGTLDVGESISIVISNDDFRGILFAPSDQNGCDMERIEITSPIILTMTRS